MAINFSNSLYKGSDLITALNLFRQGGSQTPRSSVDFATGDVNIDPMARGALGRSYTRFLGRTNETRRNLLSNANPFIQAQVDPLLRRIESGRGELSREVNRTGVRGTFRDRSLLDYDIGASREEGNARALATQNVLNNVNALDAAQFEAGSNFATNVFNQELESLGLGVDTVAELNRLAAGAYAASVQGKSAAARTGLDKDQQQFGMWAAGLDALGDVLGFGSGASLAGSVLSDVLPGGTVRADGGAPVIDKGTPANVANAATKYGYDASWFDMTTGAITDTAALASQIAVNTSTPAAYVEGLLNEQLEFGVEGAKLLEGSLNYANTGVVSPEMVANASNPSFVNSAVNFLKTPIGGGLGMALVSGIMTGNWAQAAAQGAAYAGASSLATAMGAGSWAGPIGAVAGLAAGLLGIGDEKPHRSRHWIDFSPDTDNVASRSESGGSFEDFTYTGGQYNRNYNTNDAEAMRAVVEGTGKQTQMLLDVIGIPETEQDFLIIPREGRVYVWERLQEGQTGSNWKYDPNQWNQLFASTHSGGPSRTAMPLEEQWNEGMSALSFHVIRKSAIDAGGWAAKVANSYKGSDPAVLYKRLHAASPNIQAA